MRQPMKASGAFLLLAPFAALHGPAAAQDTTQLGTIDVIGVTPERGAELPQDMLPYNVQSAGSDDFERAQVLDATDYLERHMAAVTLNAVQGNPLQPDLQFRGFTASPLLGGAQGVSVYVDGVRVNEVFGDTVNWDLIPEEAMARLSLLSGANPVFGLNTLGGTIQIRTKNGFSDPGTHAEAYAGSFGRSESTLESAGNDGRCGYYMLANHFEERGWRDLSNSNVGTLLGTLSWRGDAGSLDLHLAHAENKLTGNAAQAPQLLAVAPRSVFTAPDRTQNFYSGVTLEGAWRVATDTSLNATAFARQVDTRSYNGDLSDLSACADDTRVLCDGTQRALDQHGAPLSAAYDAINNIGVRKQASAGGSLQAVFKQPLFGRKNQFVVGIDYDRGRVDYRALQEASYLYPFDHDPGDTFVTAADTGLLLADATLAAHIAVANTGLFASDTWSATEKLALTLSGRANRTHTSIADRGGNNPDLDGSHAFQRFNPAAGMTWRWSAQSNAYAGYSESTRAPTPVELTCASPSAPCKLPNDFIADPPLQQVVARSLEAGLRGKIALADGTLHWQAGMFRTRNRHDILFQTTGGAQANEGFFANAGDTRRQGVELALRGTLFARRLEWYANYARIDATFRTPFVERSVHHPDADAEGLIAVAAGARIPGLPRNVFKLGADARLGQAFGLGCDIVYNSAQYLRGDEANRLAPVGGYARVNLRVNYALGAHVSLFARVENLFDRRYASFGVLGDASGLHPAIDDPRFVSPGAPRAAWLGLKLDL